MLNEIIFRNFKCFEESSVVLSNLTVLTGLNGMGKSTVMQGLLSLRQSYEYNGLRDGLHLHGNYVDLGYGKDIMYEKSTDDSIIGITIYDEIGEYEYNFVYEPESNVLKNVGLIQSEKIGDILSTNQFIFLSANRIIPEVRYRLGNNSEVDKRNFDKNGEYALQYIDMHGNDTFFSDEKSSLNLEINKWLQEITPGASPVVTINQDMSYSGLRFQFREGSYKTMPYKAINVGFGLTYVLPVIVCLLTARKGDYILIENPEAHIHPRGQRKIGELISLAASRGAQIIIETHSDHIMNGIRSCVKRRSIHPDSVSFVYFYQDLENYEHLHVYPQLDEYGKFDYWPEGFFDEWDDALMELL